MTVPTNTLWNSQKSDVSGQQEAVERLSRMTAGNDNLVTEPGLTLALFQGNASPSQAQAIDSFLGGLKAEQAVRTAAAAGQKIQLSEDQKTQLTQMGVNYSAVEYTQQDATAAMKTQMAAQGVQPVLDKTGNVQYDKTGNVIVEAIPKKKKKSDGWFDSFGGFFHHVTHNPVTNFVGTGSTQGSFAGGPTTGTQGIEDVGSGLNAGYQWVSATASQNFHTSTDPIGSAQSQTADNELASRLGYDPSSFFSMQAFKAKGYAHNSTSDASAKWDAENPNGLYGLNGDQAVTEAEVFAADPQKYMQRIVSDTSLTPAQTDARIKMTNSEQFKQLVDRVNASHATIGTDLANGVGIDPVKHSTLFKVTSAAGDVAASFIADPLAIGLTGWTAYQRSSAAIRSFADSEGITKILTAGMDGSHVTAAQSKVQSFVKSLVTLGNDARDAEAAGDTVRLAQIEARASAHPLGALLGDVMGKDQIVGLKAEHELTGARGELPFVTGPGEAIDTYSKAVDYLASKSALLRLQGGKAPVESSVMPGALSSYGYSKVKGSLSSWSTGRSATKAQAAAEKTIAWASADPARLSTLIKDGFLTRVLPADDDAVDVLRGSVLGVQEDLVASEKAWSASKAALETARANGADAATVSQLERDTAKLSETADANQNALASAKRALSSSGDVAITDAGRGMIRRNMLDYGRVVAPSTMVGKIASTYTLGSAQRARLTVARFTNWLPRDTRIDITSTASSDTVRKIARTYMTSGDANMLSMRWVLGDAETRKSIVQGLRDQILHASGVTRTAAGSSWVNKGRRDVANDLLNSANSTSEKYASFGREFTDTNGRNAAQWPGQVQTSFTLPNFGSVHKAAAKLGLYEGTMGRLLGSTPFEKLMIQWKLGALATPVTAVRANIESWLNAHAEGLFRDGVESKAVLREFDRLAGEDISRSRPVDKILSLAPLQAAGRYYRHVVTSKMDPAIAKAIASMPDDLLHGYVHDQAAYHYAMSMDPGGVDEATRIAREGFHPRKVQYDSKQGFDKVVHSKPGWELTDEVDGANGANAYAHNLAIRVNQNPGLAKAVIARIEAGAGADSDAVTAALDADRTMGQSLYGKVFVDDAGNTVKALTPDEITKGKQQWADQITEEFKQLVTGRNGALQSKITGHIKTTGQAPDADWILANVKGMNRPQYLLKPIVDATPGSTGVKGFLDNIQDAEGRGYQWLVERLIQRHSTSPLFAAAYGKSKVGLEEFKTRLIDGGLSEEAAERSTAEVAAGQAWSRIARMVDDPHMKSQMDVVGRGFFAFSRATTMMLRRWGSTLYRNPQVARRYQLAAEGAVHSGLVYKDQNGDWMFHFPASGVAQEVLFHAMSNIPGLQGLAQFPTSDFTGRVTSIIPGSDNPFQYQTNPIVSISGRTIAGFFPEHRELFDEVDRKMNGSLGAGQGILPTLEPSLAKKLLDPLSDSRDSITTSAMVGSLYNLYAAGMVPKDGASPAELDEFMGRLKTQTKTQLYLRAFLGAFSPATVSVPENENGSSKADFGFASAGAQGLRDEYKQILNWTKGDVARATAIWTGLHPDLTVYTQSGSQSLTKNADMPATQQAYQWMSTHTDFIQKYKSVSAFFLPPAAANAPYSQAAYRAQLEEGLRQKKTPAEFLNSVRVADAAGPYYAMEDQYNTDIATAKAAGDTSTVSARNADWAAWSKAYKAAHPTFAQHVESSVANEVVANSQFSDLRLMVQRGDTPGDAMQRQAVAGMVQAYDGFRQFEASHPGTTTDAKAARASAFQMLQDYLSEVVAVAPGLSDLYMGVFRPLSGYNLASMNK